MKLAADGINRPLSGHLIATVARPPIYHDIIEWYDEPEPDQPLIPESKLLPAIWVLIGLGVLGLVLRLVYGLRRR